MNFTQTEIEFIKQNYKDLTQQEIADHFGVKKTVIYYQLKKLGLKKSNQGRKIFGLKKNLNF